MKRYKIVDQHGNTIKRSHNLKILNDYIRQRGVKASLTSTDVDWLDGHDEALIGYDMQVTICD